MFCFNCGSRVADGDVFCMNCGAKQEEQAAPAAVVEEAVQAPVAEPVAAPVAAPVAVPVAAPEAVPAAAPVIPQNAVMVTNWKNSFFDGTLLGLIGVNLLVAFVSAITVGLAAPALTCYRLRWIYKHTCIGGYRLKFTGKGWPLFGKYLLWGFLTIITIGIYGLWVPIKFKKWEISHVEIDSVIAQ